MQPETGLWTEQSDRQVFVIETKGSDDSDLFSSVDALKVHDTTLCDLGIASNAMEHDRMIQWLQGFKIFLVGRS